MEEVTSVLLERLQETTIDVALMALPIPRAHFVCEELLLEPSSAPFSPQTHATFETQISRKTSDPRHAKSATQPHPETPNTVKPHPPRPLTRSFYSDSGKFYANFVPDTELIIY